MFDEVIDGGRTYEGIPGDCGGGGVTNAGRPKGFAKSGTRANTRQRRVQAGARQRRPSNEGTWLTGRTHGRGAVRVRPRWGCLSSLIAAAVFGRD